MKREKKTKHLYENFANYLIKNSFSKEQMTSFLATLIILFLLAGGIIAPDKDFSDRENRVLAEKPEISLSSLKDGSFMEDTEKYVSDHFLWRNSWIELRTKTRTALGSYDSNGVYKGANEYLFEDLAAPDEVELDKNITAINSFAESTNLPVYMMLVPNAANVMSEYLPANAPVRNQNQDIDNVKSLLSEKISFIDVRDVFNGKYTTRQLYYRTDHHWTTDAAQIAFEQAAIQMEIIDTVPNYNFYALTNKFSGTLAAKSGFSVKKDTIKTFIDLNEVDYVVEYTEEAEKKVSLYELDKLNGSDKYAVFFGGNHAQIEISTTSASKGKILIIKDSYANCFVPFLLPYYSKIVMVDPRYFYGDINELVTNESINQILYLYNANTFFEDNYLCGVIGSE